MKKLFNNLGLLCLLMFGFNICVSAEHSDSLEGMESGVGSLNGSVVIADVDVPVYNVGVYWDDLTFEWSYNREKQEFNWMPTARCGYQHVENEDEFYNIQDGGVSLYSDETCSTFAGETYDEEADYYVLTERESVFFGIEDYSELGQVVPSIKWNAASDYSYVDAEFTVDDDVCVEIPSERVFEVAKNYGLYTDNSCSIKTEATTFQANTYYAIVRQERVLDTEELPDSVRVSGAGDGAEVDGYVFENYAYDRINYFVNFTLKNKTAPTTTPKVGDTIGSITISFRAK